MKIKNVTISSDFTTDVSFKLQTEAVSGEEVTVFANRNKIVKDLTSSTSVISSDDFDILPVTEISEVLDLSLIHI